MQNGHQGKRDQQQSGKKMGMRIRCAACNRMLAAHFEPGEKTQLIIKCGRCGAFFVWPGTPTGLASSERPS